MNPITKPLALLTLGAFLLVARLAAAEVRLPAIFSDHMVLQQDTTVPIWGCADPGEEVSVAIAEQRKSVRADTDGKWKVELNQLRPGQTLTLTVKGKNTVIVNDVLVGEVWLGSGQSNMQFAVRRAQDLEKEKQTANFPQIRMFKVESGAAATAQPDCKGSWLVCTPESVIDFSAALFFFGREIHQALGVPVGLINSSVGGTPIQLWISPEAQRAAPELKQFFAAIPETTNTAGANSGKKPKTQILGGLFNGKIAPLIPYALRGVLWYQGEANTKSVERARYYEHQLPLLITDWRKRWGQELPFAWVQLPNFAKGGDGWCVVREAMLKSLKLPRTGMAITVDVGEPDNIHPKNKQEVGRRLSLWALGAIYGKKVASISGPLPAGHQIKGSEMKVSFQHADGGLKAKGVELKGFSLAGEDRQWHPAQARIAGAQAIVSSAEVKQPVALRYAWQDNPDCNLYNGAGLPASPFRTDDWR
jgi:sialate O-acetylesterase